MMEEEVQIESAAPADVTAILRLVRDLAVHEKSASAVTATEEQMRDALFGEHPSAEAIVARRGEGTVGFAVFFPTFSTWTGRPGLHLDDLYVVPGERGRELGRRMLRHLAALAVRRGYGRFEWFVMDWNETARNFYQRLGAATQDGKLLQHVEGRTLLVLARQD